MNGERDIDPEKVELQHNILSKWALNSTQILVD